MTYRVPLSIFLATLVLLLISSRDTFAAHRRNYPTRAPEEITHSSGTLKMHDFGPQKVSVTFWKSDDAASRIENIKEALRAQKDPKLTHIGVNVGDDPAIAAAYLKRDRLDGDTLQLFADPDAGFIEQYGLGTVYH